MREKHGIEALSGAAKEAFVKKIRKYAEASEIVDNLRDQIWWAELEMTAAKNDFDKFRRKNRIWNEDLNHLIELLGIKRGCRMRNKVSMMNEDLDHLIELLGIKDI